MPSPAFWGLVAAAGIGAAAWRRRRSAGERVDVYLDDGSMISFRAGSDEADALLPLARDLLRAARA
jgi:hypothetical protein